MSRCRSTNVLKRLLFLRITLRMRSREQRKAWSNSWTPYLIKSLLNFFESYEDIKPFQLSSLFGCPSSYHTISQTHLWSAIAALTDAGLLKARHVCSRQCPARRVLGHRVTAVVSRPWWRETARRGPQWRRFTGHIWYAKGLATQIWSLKWGISRDIWMNYGATTSYPQPSPQKRSGSLGTPNHPQKRNCQ